MDGYLRDTIAMETMLLDAFPNNDQLGDDAHVVDKFSSTTPLFGLGGQSKSTQLGKRMLLYNLKGNFGLLNACFSEILR